MKLANRPKPFDLGQAAKKGVAWIVTGRVLILLITIGAGMVLSRLLEPQDFGICGIARIFTGIITRLGNLGFGQALIQRKEIHDDHVSSFFMFNLLIFSLLATLLILVSPFIGASFGSPLAGRVLAVAALTYFADPFSSVARVLMQRRMNFKGPTIADVVENLVTMAASIVLAWRGCGVWSLVYGPLCGTLLSTILLVVQSQWRPRFKYKHAAIKELYSFGLNMTFKRLLIYGTDKIDYFFTGKQLGPIALGFYEKSFNLMDIAVKELSLRVGPVLFSSFSKIQDDQIRIVHVYHKVILTLSLIAYPIFFGLFLVAPTFIHIVYGEKWMPSALPLQIMCVAGLMRMHLQVTSSVVNAMGKVAGDVWRRAIGFIILAFSCWLGSFWGIVGVSVMVTIVTSLLAIIMASYLKNLMGLTWTELLRPERPAMVASVVMAGVVLGYRHWAAGVLGTYSVAMLFSSTAVGVVGYSVALWMLRPSAVVSLLQEFMADLKPVFQGIMR
jgi:O-antigen/teichoic acid export membrane protein